MRFKQATVVWALLAALPALAQQSPIPGAPGKVQKKITYATLNGKALTLDLYLPATPAADKSPVIIRFSPHHENPARPANELLARGYALAYATYLPNDTPDNQSFSRFPNDLHAAKAAIRWLRGNAEAQHLDPDRIAVWADGDGATIAALLAVTPDQPALNGTLGDYPKLSTAIRAVCLFGGTTDWRDAELYGDETVNIPGSPAYQLFGNNPKDNPDDARLASAVNYIRPTSPATLMVTLSSDANRAMHLIYAETLRRAGVASALYEEPAGAATGPGGRAVDEARLDRTILDFFNDTLSPDKTPPKMSLPDEIHQLASAGLFKQARRLIEEQVGLTTGADRQRWLTQMRQVAEQQRDPAMQKLMSVMKEGKAGPHTQWTIREVLTDPDKIGQYQVEAAPSMDDFDRRAELLKQIDALNTLVQKKEWPAADRLLNSLRTADRDPFAAAALNEAAARYQAAKNVNASAWPPQSHSIGYANDFGIDLYGYWFDLRAGGITQRFRYIPPGTYARGSAPDEWGRLPNEPPLAPTDVKQGFWISDTPVTQAMMEGVLGQSGNHSHFHGPTLPADSVSYAHAINFLNKLGIDARLPTDIEWEYAARAGTREPFPATGRPSDIAWFWNEASTEGGAGGMNVRILNELETDRTTTPRSTHPVKQKLPNAWGLYDMQGNVWEWCTATSADHPRNLYPLHGGSWISIPQSCRAGRETWLPIETQSWNIGMRIVIPAK
ncbi:MAG: SUMF1/EgtB/PvdO family nonheme iron enzyme [Phycisphaerae bacterium]